MSSFGSLLARTLREPLAWGGAVAVALVGAEGPADWIAGELPSIVRTPSLLHAMAGYNAAPAVFMWLALATLGWVCRIPLVAATVVVARGNRTPTLPFLLKNFSRVLRTRGVSLMVTAAFAFIPASALFAWAKKAAGNPLPNIGLAALLALAGGWLALGDRFALGRFDARQDQIARKAREDAYNAPYYLDTGKERAGYGVATGADNAVTDAGWALLDARAFGIVGITVALDLVRVVGTGFIPAPVPGIVARVVLGAFSGIVSAVLWTRYFQRLKP